MSDLRVWWWRWRYPTELNFGDEMTAPLLERLTGRRVVWTPIQEADVVGAGSVLIQTTKARLANMPYIWGSGFINPYQGPQPDGFVPAALRGRLSRAHYPAETHDRIALGDPGILADRLIDGPVSKKYALGVIPHYKDATAPIVKELAGLSTSVRVVDVAWTPEEVAREIASCETVLSSSMHGLIFADSLGVPNAHVRISERVGGKAHGSYKFADYYSAFEGREHRPWSVAQVRGRTVDDLVQGVRSEYTQPEDIEKLQRGLLGVLPQ